MTQTAITVREPQPVALSNNQLEQIARTEFVPRGLRGNLPAILACVATGREIGIGDMTALRSIHLVDGRPAFSAELMVMLVRRAGHSITGEVGDGTATVTGRRADNGDEMRVTWTLEMAKRAGLAGKQNWQRYPEAMLWARAVSQLSRMLFADVFAGGTYTPEEFGDEGLGSEVVEGERAGEVSADYPHDQTEPADIALAQIAERLEENLLEHSSALDVDLGLVREAVAGKRSEHAGDPELLVGWLEQQIGRAEVAIQARAEAAEAESPFTAPLASKAQQRLMVTAASKAGLDDDARHALMERVTGQPSTKAVGKHQVQAVLDAIAEVPA